MRPLRSPYVDDTKSNASKPITDQYAPYCSEIRYAISNNYNVLGRITCIILTPYCQDAQRFILVNGAASS